ncbi:MAG TPA: hypothetical protein VIK51_13230 [Vicinamibacteria bacterium]|jgi:hypothetical protein
MSMSDVYRRFLNVQEWRRAHLAELEDDWDRASGRQPLNPIAPLE